MMDLPYSDIEYVPEPDDRMGFSTFTIDNDYEFDSDDESDYEETESESSENMRDELTNLENTIKDSCHKIQDFIFEISESNKISQNDYLQNSNNIKHIYESYKKSIHLLSNINNVISLNYEEKNIELNDAMNENKQLKIIVKDLKLMNKSLKDTLKQALKITSHKDKLKMKVSLNTIYTQYYNNAFKKPQDSL